MSAIKLKCDKCKEFRDDKECWIICDGCYEDPKQLIGEFIEDLNGVDSLETRAEYDIEDLIKKWEAKKLE